ncbi:hypothetical protein ACF1BQ_019910 [Bradyrhizobium sp. RDT10]
MNNTIKSLSSAAAAPIGVLAAFAIPASAQKAYDAGPCDIIRPAGLENAQGLISAVYLKDPAGQRWDTIRTISYHQFVSVLSGELKL